MSMYQLVDVCEGLQHLHSEKIAHGDLKSVRLPSMRPRPAGF